VRALPSAVLLLRRLLSQTDAVRALSGVLLPRRLLPQADAVPVLARVAGKVQLRAMSAAAITPTISG
jgi:hypothetical protein